MRGAEGEGGVELKRNPIIFGNFRNKFTSGTSNREMRCLGWNAEANGRL